MKKRTILQVGPLPPPIGGMSVFLNQLKQFESDDYELRFFNIFPKKNTPLHKAAHNAIVLFKFLWVLLTVKPDLVHIHTAGYRAFTKSSYFVRIAKKLNFRVMLHIHSGKFVEFFKKSPSKKQHHINETLLQCDRLVCLSPSWKKQFGAVFAVEESRFDVLTNAIFVDDFAGVSPAHAAEGKSILFVGKLGENKGILDIIEMAKRLKDRSDIKFLLMGSGPLKEKLQQEISAHNLNIELLGSLSGEEKIAHYRRANIFILPSYFEALGLANLEGMAAGHVILSTHVGGIPDIIHDGKEGFLFEPGDVDGFVDKVLSLDGETMERISQHNQEKAKDYDFAELNRSLAKIYDRLLT